MFVGGALIGLTTTAAGRIGKAIFPAALHWPHMERMTSTTLADVAPIDWRSAILTTVRRASALALVLINDCSPVTPLPSLLSRSRGDCSLACSDQADGLRARG
jgi:hypothetical protein